MAFRMSDVASIGQGALDAYMKSNQINDIQGAAALGRAFQQQPQQGPIDQLNAQGPQAPPPGQASTPSMAGGPQGMSSLPIYNQPAGPQLPAQGPPQAPPPSGGGGMFGGMAGWDPGERPVGSAPIGAGPVQPPIPQGPPDPQMLAREGGNMPPAAGGAFPGPQQGPGGMPQFDLRTLSARINAANPNLPPAVMIAALERAAPLLNAQSKTELAQLKQYMDQQNLQLRRDTLDVREGIANQRSQDTRYGVDTRAGTAATAEQGRGERATQAEEGRTSRTTQREEGASERAAAGRSSREGIAERAETGRNERFKANYDRLTTNAENRFKDSAARLDEMVKRRLSGEDRSRAVRELRTLEDQARADHNAIMEQIQAGFLGNAQDKKRLMAEAVAKRDENMKRIEAYRSQIKAGGQTEAPVGALPPEARSSLKEGTITTFQNGQRWTLENGQPKQVPDTGGQGASPFDKRSMSDEQPDPIRPGAQYAMDVGKQRKGVLSDVPTGKGRGEGGAGGVERAFEQVRKENAGLTREQRREKMRQEGQKEFDDIQNLSDADYEQALAKIRKVLGKR